MRVAFATVAAATAVASAVATVVAMSGCSHHLVQPASWQWGMPVYPNASPQGKSAGNASFVLYRTRDSVDEVYGWYLAQLPKDTPHAYSAEKRQATFALFDARRRRTVHIQGEGSATAIFLTELKP